MKFFLKTEHHFYSFIKDEGGYKIIEDLKFDLCVLSEKEFDYFLGLTFDYMMMQDSDVELLVPIDIKDRGEFISKIKSFVFSSLKVWSFFLMTFN